MNKNTLKLAVTALTCLTLCGTTLAAPGKGGQGNRGKAPAQPRQHQVAERPQQQGHARHEVRQPERPPRQKAQACHTEEPRRNHAPRPEPRHEKHGRCMHHEDWVTAGAAALGGLVGGLLGAAH